MGLVGGYQTKEVSNMLVTHQKGWWNAFWYNYLKRIYNQKMLHHKLIAEYNLLRHNEAVENYNQKKGNRTPPYGKMVDASMGFYISDEHADDYAANYNENWGLYIRYKQKLEVLTAGAKPLEEQLPEEESTTETIKTE